MALVSQVAKQLARVAAGDRRPAAFAHQAMGTEGHQMLRHARVGNAKDGLNRFHIALAVAQFLSKS